MKCILGCDGELVGYCHIGSGVMLEDRHTVLSSSHSQKLTVNKAPLSPAILSFWSLRSSQPCSGNGLRGLTRPMFLFWGILGVIRIKCDHIMIVLNKYSPWQAGCLESCRPVTGQVQVHFPLCADAHPLILLPGAWLFRQSPFALLSLTHLGLIPLLSWAFLLSWPCYWIVNWFSLSS